MSLQELKFYKCKLCEYELVAGKYCIDCAKTRSDKIKFKKALNTKQKSPGYPFIDPSLSPNYEQEFTGTFAGTSAGCTTVATTDFPIWTNFTAAGNATNIDLGTSATVPSGSVMDISFSPITQIGQDMLSSRKQKARHK